MENIHIFVYTKVRKYKKKLLSIRFSICKIISDFDFLGFCQYFETESELKDHYEAHPNHRLTKQDHDGFRRNAEKVKWIRAWNFPRFETVPLNQCKISMSW